MTLVLLAALLSGCAGSVECGWVRPIHFSDQMTVDWLIENDPTLLAEVVILNETQSKVCR